MRLRCPSCETECDVLWQKIDGEMRLALAYDEYLEVYIEKSTISDDRALYCDGNIEIPHSYLERTTVIVHGFRPTVVTGMEQIL